MILSVCDVPDVLKVIKIIKLIITIIKIIVPIILIITCMIDYMKATGDGSDVGKVTGKIVKKIIAAVLIFIIPTVVNIIIKVVDPKQTTYLSCFSNATTEKIEALYKENMDKLIAIVEEKKDNASLQTAKLYMTNIKDKTLKKEYNDKLKKLEKEIQTPPITYNGLSPEEFMSKLNSMETPTMEKLKAAAKENGISDDYFVIIVGTTFNEGYYNDPYLYYGWASTMINVPATYESMKGWDPSNSSCTWQGGINFYSPTCVQTGYAHVDSNTKKAIYLALTNRNKKIVGCNGMDYTKDPSYVTIYESKVYNCRIIESK